MGAELISRIIGMLVFAALGVYWGQNLGELASENSILSFFAVWQFAIALGIVGAVIGLFITPYITIRPLSRLFRTIKQISSQNLFASLLGLVIGLIIGALLAYPLSLLPTPFGEILPFVGVLLCCYVGISVSLMRQNDLFSMFSSVSGRSPLSIGSADRSKKSNDGRGSVLLDTSVIIDGRIADIAPTGFIPGTLQITRFVLNELQYIADSPDSMRRQRGRRGMDILSQLQRDTSITVNITDMDVEGVKEVDEKLVILARQLRCPILTNDYNLNRIAELQGVKVMNINELANAVKSILLPGEVLFIRVIQEGKEPGQGVGYLEDGTMVVVENGRELINQQVEVTVTKVLQTAAGRMIFGRPETHDIGRI